jgi:CheY-like chemotaxis protein
MLAVSDTGIGMDAATMARIFEPFFTTKGEGKGTGLGLATVFGIVKQSGGHVAVYSEPGGGATFKIYLPRVGGENPSAVTRLAQPVVPRGTETILLVEDEPALLALSRHLLSAQGYTVLEAGCGEKATRAAKQYEGTIHLLVTDVVMPGLSGRQVAERITALRPGVRVLFLSGYTDDAVIRHGVLQAESAFLQKPYTPAALAQKVREVLDQPAPAGGAMSPDT